MSDISFLKSRTELTSEFKNRKLSFCSSAFRNQLQRFRDSFSRCFIYNSSSFNSHRFKVFIFNSAWKYVIARVIIEA